MFDLTVFCDSKQEAVDFLIKNETRRKRLKSALYLRLKKHRLEICIVLFPELRLLFTKNSDITSKVRLYYPKILKYHDICILKYHDIYILKYNDIYILKYHPEDDASMLLTL